MNYMEEVLVVTLLSDYYHFDIDSYYSLVSKVCIKLQTTQHHHHRKG